MRSRFLIFMLSLCLPATALAQDPDSAVCWTGAELADDAGVMFGSLRTVSVDGDSLLLSGYDPPTEQLDRMLSVPLDLGQCDGSDPITVLATVVETARTGICGQFDADTSAGLSDGMMTIVGGVADNADGRLVVYDLPFPDEIQSWSAIVWDAVLDVGGHPGFGVPYAFSYAFDIDADGTDLAFTALDGGAATSHPALAHDGTLWFDFVGTEGGEQYQIESLCVEVVADCLCPDADDDGVCDDEDRCEGDDLTGDDDGDGICNDLDVDDCDSIIPDTCLTIWQAHARGFLHLVSSGGQGEGVTFTNVGDVPVCLDEQALYTSLQTQALVIDQAVVDDGVILGPGEEITLYYGSWTTDNGRYERYLGEYAWWCVEAAQYVQPGQTFDFFGERAPEDILEIVNGDRDADGDGVEDHVDWAGGFGVQTNYSVWDYQTDHTVMTIGKTAEAVDSEIEVTLTAQNIGALAGTVTITDTVPTGWTVTFIDEPGNEVVNDDGTITATWSVTLDGTDRLVVDLEEITYTLARLSGTDALYVELGEASAAYFDGEDDETASSMPAALYGLDVDGDGEVACLCDDADNDGTCDDEDGCPADPLKVEPGACGCGEPDGDEDGNGIEDCVQEDLFLEGRRSHVKWHNSRPYALFTGRMELGGGLLAPDFRDGDVGHGQIQVEIGATSPVTVYDEALDYEVYEHNNGVETDNREKWRYKDGNRERATMRWRNSMRYRSKNDPAMPGIRDDDNWGRMHSRFIHTDETRLRVRWNRRTELPLTIVIDGVPLVTIAEDGDDYQVTSPYETYEVYRKDGTERRRVVDIAFVGDRLGDGNVIAWYADDDPDDGLDGLLNSHEAIDQGTGDSVWYNAGASFNVKVPLDGYSQPDDDEAQASLWMQFGDADTDFVITGEVTYCGYEVAGIHWRASEVLDDGNHIGICE